MSREYNEVLPTTREKYVGKVFPSNNYGNFEILEYNAVNDVKIRFLETGFTDTVFVDQVRTRRVRDYMKPLIVGKGIVGAKLTTEESKHKAYKNWCRILNRCYDENQRHKHPTYLGCTVSEFFLTYTNFRDWYVKQKNWDNPDFVLDKDLLSPKDNKVYSENTCCFVPAEINSLFIKSDAARGDLPIGVNYHKASRKFVAQVSRFKKVIHLGCFNTPDEAFNAYKEAKEAYIKEVANKWKDQIDPRVYEALMKYRVEITD